MSACTPTAASVQVRRSDDGAVGTVTIEPDDAVFPGHYPGFPVLPGLYLVEFVHQTVLAALERPDRMALGTIEDCRFVGPVYPGDKLTIETSLSRAGDDLRCSATVSTGMKTVARLRLCYREAGTT